MTIRKKYGKTSVEYHIKKFMHFKKMGLSFYKSLMAFFFFWTNWLVGKLETSGDSTQGEKRGKEI